MGDGVWLAILATCAGTFAMRVVPLLWMRHRLSSRTDENRVETVPGWLGVLGPLMIAALLGVSMLPTAPNVADVLATLFGAAATLLIWSRTRSLGWPVFAGVLVYGAVTLLVSVM